MTLLALPGGTDVAEMALFATDNLPDEAPDSEGIRRLEEAGALICFPTGADGAYLLHTYVDQAIPDEVLAWCERDDPIEGQLALPAGKLAFGGVESAWRGFRPNPNIRSDGSIPPGRYAVTAYRTEIPEGACEAARAEALSPADRRALGIPKRVFAVGVVAIVVALVLKHFIAAAAILVALPLWWRWFRTRPGYLTAMEKDTAVQLRFPSIVAALVSQPAAGR